jgi:hypothetical protein
MRALERLSSKFDSMNLMEAVIDHGSTIKQQLL